MQKIKEQDGEGCQVFGSLEVNKVAGNFHFAPGKSFQQANMHVHDLMAFGKDSFNMSHKVNEITFGVRFPGVVNPLNGLERIQTTTHGMYQYFIKVVPTVYTDIYGRKIASNQFSVTDHFTGGGPGEGQSLPGVFFFYDLSPIKVKFTEKRMSFLHFITNVCAIVGGIFTVSGIIDAFVYHGHKTVKHKLGLGKLN